MDDIDIDDGVVFGFEQEKRRRFIAELRESNSAASAELEREIVERAHTRPIESAMDRDRRELAEQEAQRAAEREAKRAPAGTLHPDWEAWLRARLDAERAFVLECVGTALGQALRKERAASKRELSDEVKRLRIELAAADETLSELRRTIDAGKRSGDIIDLQPIARRN